MVLALWAASALASQCDPVLGNRIHILRITHLVRPFFFFLPPLLFFFFFPSTAAQEVNPPFPSQSFSFPNPAYVTPGSQTYPSIPLFLSLSLCVFSLPPHPSSIPPPTKKKPRLPTPLSFSIHKINQIKPAERKDNSHDFAVHFVAQVASHRCHRPLGRPGQS